MPGGLPDRDSGVGLADRYVMGPQKALGGHDTQLQLQRTFRCPSALTGSDAGGLNAPVATACVPDALSVHVLG
jgi:hypothetical protein